MSKDKDRDLVDRINSALTEDIQQMLEKVLDCYLKPVILRLDLIEQRLGNIEKDQKKLEARVKRVQKTIDLVIKVFDKDINQVRKRVDKIEGHLGMN